MSPFSVMQRISLLVGGSMSESSCSIDSEGIDWTSMSLEKVSDEEDTGILGVDWCDSVISLVGVAFLFFSSLFFPLN